MVFDSAFTHLHWTPGSTGGKKEGPAANGADAANKPVSEAEKMKRDLRRMEMELDLIKVCVCYLLNMFAS